MQFHISSANHHSHLPLGGGYCSELNIADFNVETPEAVFFVMSLYRRKK